MKWNGKKTWFSCGSFPENDIQAIRSSRDEAKKLLAQGIDPRLQKQVVKIENQHKLERIIEEEKENDIQNKNFYDLFSVWVEDGVTRADGNEEIIRMFNKDVLPIIGKMALRQITENDLRNIYRSILKRATEKNPRERLVLRLASDMRQLFKWADARQPWRSLLKNEENAYNDLKSTRFQKKPLNVPTQCAIWLCLSTLCRIGELLKAEWIHIDFEKGIWFIPRENIKGIRGKKQDHYIFLSEFSKKYFEILFQKTGTSNWCFPSRDGLSHVDLKSISKRIGDRQIKFKDRSKASSQRRHDNSLAVGDQEWTPHDLRRTGATMMQELGIDIDIIDRCQNHIISGSKVRRHYLKYDYAEEKKQAWALLGKKLERIISIKKQNHF